MERRIGCYQRCIFQWTSGGFKECIVLVEKQQIGVEGFQGSQGLIPLVVALCQGSLRAHAQLVALKGSLRGLCAGTISTHPHVTQNSDLSIHDSLPAAPFDLYMPNCIPSKRDGSHVQCWLNSLTPRSTSRSLSDPVLNLATSNPYPKPPERYVIPKP